jgi:hypothetical protein
MEAPHFVVGDRVAWSHQLGALFGTAAVLKRAVVHAQDKAAVVGTVTAVANEAGTWFAVTFDADEVARLEAVAVPGLQVPADGSHVLTFEELVKVEE